MNKIKIIFKIVFLIVVAFLLNCCVAKKPNNNSQKKIDQIDLKNILKDSKEQELYEFKLESIREKYPNNYYGIFSFESKKAFELSCYSNGDLDKNESDEEEIEPDYPIFYKNIKNKWEKFKFPRGCGWGKKVFTLKPNKKYNIIIPISYYFNYIGDGIVTINDLKSDIFDTEIIHQFIGRQKDSKSELILNNSFLQKYYFNGNNFKSLKLINKENFDLTKLTFAKGPYPIEIKTYITPDLRYTIINSNKISKSLNIISESIDIAVYENTAIPKFNFLYTAIKENNNILREGIIIFNDKDYDFESIKYVDSYSNSSLTPPVVIKKLKNQLPTYPIIYTPSIHILGPKLFPNETKEFKITEIYSVANQSYTFPIEFSFFDETTMARTNSDSRGFKIFLKNELFLSTIIWTYNDKNEFIKREHFRAKQSWEN